jgi:hypothetical protein
VDALLCEGLIFELFLAETAEDTMATPAIVIRLNINNHRHPLYFITGKSLSITSMNILEITNIPKAPEIIIHSLEKSSMHVRQLILRPVGSSIMTILLDWPVMSGPIGLKRIKEIVKRKLNHPLGVN